jgi:hypothetical protein
MNKLKDMYLSNDAVLPYAGTSGWSGTDTSKARASDSDKSGKTKDSQSVALKIVALSGHGGVTLQELSHLTRWHHGLSSGVLSILHKEGMISRLLEKRGKCRVYVANNDVDGRETDSQGRKPKECPNCGHLV